MPGSRRADPGALALAACTVVISACASKPPPPPAASETSINLLAALRAAQPLNAMSITEDPYATWAGRSPPQPLAAAVCGVRFEPDRIHYRLTTFDSEALAREAGYAVTHAGQCGVCSTLQDLAVYLERPDLTAPVRRCGMMTDSGSMTCLEALGFSHACARIWAFNAENTRRQCFGVCVRSWMSSEPSTKPDGSLNDCLQCDEDRSGPVFKAVAGRTRRNSGIRSSIPRRDEEVAHVVHDYVPAASP